MISAALVKCAALGGIALVWWEFTCEAIKIGQKIILLPEPPEKLPVCVLRLFFYGRFCI